MKKKKDANLCPECGAPCKLDEINGNIEIYSCPICRKKTFRVLARKKSKKKEIISDSEKELQVQNQDFNNVNIDEKINFDEDYSVDDEDEITFIDDGIDVFTENRDNEEDNFDISNIDKNNVYSLKENIITNDYKKIKITKETSEKIFTALNKRGFSLNDISSRVGFMFNYFPYEDHYISLENLDKLKSLVIDELGSNGISELFGINNIPYKNFIKSKEEITLEYNPLISEFISIILGDGYLSEKGDKIRVTLNRVDDPEYVKYIFKIIKEIFPMVNINISGTSYFCCKCNNTFTNNDSIYKDHLNYSFVERGIKEDKKIDLELHTATAYYALIKLGLIPGDKVQNRVKVPDVIFKNDDELLKIKSLKGLFDTDGSIFVRAIFDKKYQRFYPILDIHFSNSSRPLVESFAGLCSDLEIHTGDVKGPYKSNKMTYYYRFIITSKRDVRKFIDLIKPQKLKEPFRLFYLGCRLLYLSCSINIINQINQRIQKDYPREWDRRYSKEFSLYLKELCEKIFLDNGIKEILGFKFTGKISEDMVLEAIQKNLQYT